MLPDKALGCALLDQYGVLLTKHQQEILEEYYFEDLSMNEIADNYEVSKAAISDLLHRSIRILESYDEKLGLLKRNAELGEIVAILMDKGVDQAIIDRLNNIIGGYNV